MTDADALARVRFIRHALNAEADRDVVQMLTRPMPWCWLGPVRGVTRWKRRRQLQLTLAVVVALLTWCVGLILWTRALS